MERLGQGREKEDSDIVYSERSERVKEG